MEQRTNRCSKVHKSSYSDSRNVWLSRTDSNIHGSRDCNLGCIQYPVLEEPILSLRSSIDGIRRKDHHFDHRIVQIQLPGHPHKSVNISSRAVLPHMHNQWLSRGYYAKSIPLHCMICSILKGMVPHCLGIQRNQVRHRDSTLSRTHKLSRRASCARSYHRIEGTDAYRIQGTQGSEGGILRY